MTLLRLQRTPPDVRALASERGERVLAWAASDDGLVVATSYRLHVTGQGRELDWEQIDKVVWAEGVMTVHAHDGLTLVVRPAEPGAVPAVVRDRVNASIALTQKHRVHRSGSVRIVARRPARGGALVWSVVVDPDVPADDPVVQAAIDQRMAEARDLVVDRG